MSSRSVYIGLVLALMVAGGATGEDLFSRIKSELRKAPCIVLEFISVVESDLFDVVDSVDGSATLAVDGRLCARLGDDNFFRDSAFFYTYSTETNQVTIERIIADGRGGVWSLLRDFDALYNSAALAVNQRYLLTRNDSTQSDLPDSLIVTVDPIGQTISELQFDDVNGELNRIVITELVKIDTCDADRLIPRFPDSADIVRLY